MSGLQTTNRRTRAPALRTAIDGNKPAFGNVPLKNRAYEQGTTHRQRKEAGRSLQTQMETQMETASPCESTVDRMSMLIICYPMIP